ncbi:MAG: flagellar biosynthesis anti-sigma factor FlgM [Bdellovibrio sp. CG12_big_fil_rev_8_21_14_0_65_39_13]|nr:MAG: flagellar biosynthesis anti-sigma factor FlgM [Bdellovibrio sp. CG22_combo_CG10-13_8_21_14_all_39_27]PIQ60661.1 MAG: flagellar biosynthesis anti-sigma factor FlgM [Bdellovibrio sp. CG12_big_fil_rev_8_21_14_0_65_39_13]PIR37045.1 MAG: flagellar biosynthesis anti-sigma factor FlgM [Bdellovibrio sp. CG11_big_fil_rev_8_21_14_0_20_39_38]PJB52430.1 MAG: flagellar biosynthesis anti-sigma factor FlgM [Bdellovibrio sp. CG_4_9_14_3_um_filter_39_7]
MSSIDPSLNRSSFFPNSRPKSKSSSTRAIETSIQRNPAERADMLQKSTAKDAKVDINLATKDFARIRKAVDAAPERDNSAKINQLKEQINAGTYNVDYDALADKIISEGF